jgi:DNA-binding MarR family transcriptional regulator
VSDPLVDQQHAAGLGLTGCDEIGYLLMRARAMLSHAVTQHTMREFGLTNVQAGVLWMLARGSCRLASEVARETGMDASAVKRMVDRLEERGLVRRLRSDSDRRAVRLVLTDAGCELATQVPPYFRRVLAGALTGFSVEEAGFLKSLLHRLLANETGAPW